MKKSQLVSTTILTLAGFAAAVPGMPAFAQSGAAAGGTNKGDTLEEVIVTSERHQENAQKIPVSITTLTAEDLQRTGETHLDESLRDTPSLQIQNTPQGGNIYIRGVGANGDSSFVDPSVSLNVDGVYTARSERLAAGLYDVDRIEVLRGPQGTLYGRNADGGAVNIITNAPKIGSSETSLNLGTGNYSLFHEDGAQNIPVNDQMAFRVAAMHEDRDGYFTNGGYSSHVTGVRLKGIYEPDDKLTVQALFDYSHQYGLFATTVPAKNPFAGPPSFVFNSGTDSCAGPQGGWLNAQPRNHWYVDPCHPADHIDYRFYVTSAQIDYRMPWATLTLVPTYSWSARYDLTNLVVGDDAFFGGSQSGAIAKENQYTGEVRLSSPPGAPITWVAGYFYLSSTNIENVNGTVTGTVNGTTETLYSDYGLPAKPATSQAPFAQATVPLLPDFRLVAGIRYTQDSKSESEQVITVAVPGYNSGVLTATNKYNALTYKAALEYDVAPASMLYTMVATGYKAGGYDTTATPPKSYKPEKVTDYEIGSKNRFFDNKMQLNASLYYYRYTDLQVQYQDLPPPALPIPAAYIPSGAVYSNFQQYVANAATGTNEGAELELRWRVTPNDEVKLAYTYTNATYGNFTESNLTALDGKQIAATPRNVGVIGYQHSWDLFDGELSAEIDTKLSSSYYSTVNNRASNTYGFQPAYSRSDASLTYLSPADWSVSASVKNLENKAQLQFGDFPLNRVVINAPRTFGANASFKF